MAKKNQPKGTTPIMSKAEERFMAWAGLIQWTDGVISQSLRVEEAAKRISESLISGDHLISSNIHLLHCETHYYAIAANKVLEYREWAQSLGLFKNVDFSELDKTNAQAIKDLRNMREHVVEYFQGDGHAKNRWIITAPGFSADASSMGSTLIGGRLDYIQFTEIMKSIAPQLKAEPMPLEDDPIHAN